MTEARKTVFRIRVKLPHCTEVYFEPVRLTPEEESRLREVGPYTQRRVSVCAETERLERRAAAWDRAAADLRGTSSAYITADFWARTHRGWIEELKKAALGQGSLR